MIDNLAMLDPLFAVEVLSKCDRPNLLCYLAMHQDYSEDFVYSEMSKLANYSEAELGDRIVRNCVNKSHWGILEHPSITFNVINFPHSVMVQARTHRVGVSFDCQSQRYTCKRILRLAQQIEETPEDAINLIEKVFYFRAVAHYFDREGNKYFYSPSARNQDILFTQKAVLYYAEKVNQQGYAPEHARDLLTQNLRQHFVVSFNARSLLHFCDLRLPKDAQPEIRNLAELIFEHFQKWMPEVANVYAKKRMGKNLLAP
ncbi:FAD-dependent thymidylate synthase [Cyanobacterium aponinum UTEX 3221]|uniref:FAD-dependent thymidylate synthase n=1 Tax=Cyanobacterium aponinum TaxID=379064 RepID=UPI002B4C045D|nr:FAD-dependent thymidylate synthase [Cyanobacterium aponinum]WRL38196.1 FAD-dependent thymidylate synthase [Cyanobacterium aponinum UTEX 3221]